MDKRRVLILCTGNSARSQMAEALINHDLGKTWGAFSAGTKPAGYVHPLALEALRELGIDGEGQTSKSVDLFREQSFDVVITVCDSAAEDCPVWLGKGFKVHMGFEDPAEAKGSLDEKMRIFRRVRDKMRQSVIPYLQHFYPQDNRTAESQTAGATSARSQPTERVMRTHYQQELRQLQDELLMMGSMVCEALHTALDVLKRQDLDQAKHLIASDRQVNAKRYKIEETCLTLIATQQPMASDMRMLAGIMEISSELERIGDYAKGIGRITLYIGKEPLVKPLVHMPQMCVIVVEMLRAALDAFIAQDVEQARAIPKRDDEVDTLYNTINRELIDLIMANPSRIDHANYLSWAAHNLERAADRVTNICERIIYTATGQFVEMDADESI
jgi:phosphate transport system protein